MTSKPRREPDRKWETHVYMTEAEKKALERVARQESRSVNGQIMHFIRQGLADR
jgi:hypothetical protein